MVISYTFLKEVHSYGTGYSNDFHFSFSRTNLGKFSLSFPGDFLLYNFLGNDIKDSTSLSSFKSKLRKCFFKYENYQLLII